MKKILAILLASLMLVACFAGCTKEEANNDNKVSDTDVVSNADVSSTDTDANDDAVVDTNVTSDTDAEDNTLGEGEYYAFVAIGADMTANDWAYSWAGEGTTDGVTATTANAKVGETFTIGIEFATPAVYTWYVAPCIIVGEGKTVDATVNAVRIDGKDVTADVDFNADSEGKTWWYENTGNYSDTECVRLAGGYNEWATKFIANSPADYSTIEYDITINSIA